MDCSLPDSSLHVTFQVRILEWVAISFARGIPDPGIECISPVSPALQAIFFFLPAEPYRNLNMMYKNLISFLTNVQKVIFY